MPYFRRKSSPPIEANQFLKDQPAPNGVKYRYWSDGTTTAYVTTKQGQDVTVNFGEWIVTEQSGDRHYPIAADEFERLYEYDNS